MRRLVFLFVSFAVMSFALTVQAVADEKTVNATVTPKVIAVTVSHTSISYGTLSTGTSDNLPQSPTNITATNSGNVDVDLKIRGANSTPGNWVLTSSAPATDSYRHKFDLSSGGSFTALSTSNAVLANDIVPSTGSVDVFFKLDMPTVTTSFVQQTLPIFITALESTGPGPS